ncbi:MAG: QueT transporter family protein [Clostridia bacterium]|nr:QueT transporter family protein [Clostridia bacterium]
MRKFPVKALCRAGIIAAMYAALTLTLSQFAYGPIQLRPAEALTMLPLLYAESVPALFIGCLIANLLSPYGVWDIAIGSAITLIAAIATYFTPKFVKKPLLRAIVGGLFPVLLNALILPAMWLLVMGDAAFWINLLSLGATQLIFVYALGAPLVMLLKRYAMRPKSPFSVTNRYVSADIKKRDTSASDNGKKNSSDVYGIDAANDEKGNVPGDIDNSNDGE